MLRKINITRYVTPLREGGSLPAIVEGCDLGTYVLKFRGAGQGRKALVAEVIAGEIARSLGLPVPEMVLADLDPTLARSEPDPEIQDLISASGGVNLAMDYLPGSLGFDPLASPMDSKRASRILWFDALATNVDRTPHNTNLLLWHGEVWLIDHGASLYFHHTWKDWREKAKLPFAAARDHVLLPFAAQIKEADEEISAKLSEDGCEASSFSCRTSGSKASRASRARTRFEGRTSNICRRGSRSLGSGFGLWRRLMAKLYEYAVLRVVPRPERGEAINVGVVLHCPETKFLEARMHLDEGRLLSLDPALDPESVASHLEGMRRVCVGGPEAGALGKLSARERFGRVAAPRSTIVQPSPVHTGFSEDPREALERLLEEMVLPP